MQRETLGIHSIQFYLRCCKTKRVLEFSRLRQIVVKFYANPKSIFSLSFQLRDWLGTILVVRTCYKYRISSCAKSKKILYCHFDHWLTFPLFQSNIRLIRICRAVELSGEYFWVLGSLKIILVNVDNLKLADIFRRGFLEISLGKLKKSMSLCMVYFALV